MGGVYFLATFIDLLVNFVFEPQDLCELTATEMLGVAVKTYI